MHFIKILLLISIILWRFIFEINIKNLIFGVVLAVSNLAQANGGYVYFEAPLEDQVVKSPVKVIFGLAGKKSALLVI